MSPGEQHAFEQAGKRRRRTAIITIVAIALLGVAFLGYLCFRPYPDSASWWMGRAIEESHVIQASGARTRLLRLLSEVQAAEGSIEAAMETVKTIREPKMSLLAKIRREVKKLLSKFGVVSAPPQVARAFFAQVHYPEAQAYGAIAEIRAAAGDIAGARKAIKKIDTRTGAYTKAMLSIVKAQAAAGDIDGASATAEEICDEDWSPSIEWAKVESLRAMTVARAKAGDVSGARALCEALPDRAPVYGQQYQDSVCKSLVAALASTGNGEAARAIAQGIADRRDRAHAYYTIATEEAASGNPGAAATTAQEIDDPRMRAQAHAAIASGLASRGSIAEARAAAEAIAIGYYRAYAYQLVCEVQVEKGDLEGARVTLEEIDDPVCRSDAYYAMACSLLKEGDLRSAEALATLVTGDKGLALCLSLAEAHAAAGNTAGRAEWVTLAKGAADAVSSCPKAEAYCAIAEAQALSGDLAGALATVDAATRGYRFAPPVDLNAGPVGLEKFALAGSEKGRNRLEALRAVARACARGSGRVRDLARRVTALGTPLERAHASLGAAEGLMEKDKAESR